jgi:hypothetical protein
LRHTSGVARLGLIGAVLATAVTLAAPAPAPAPNYILVSGPGLQQPVLLGDWNENLQFVVAIGQGRRAKGSALRGLAPAHSGKPALFKAMIQGTRSLRIASAQALAILRRHGVPTRRG